MRPSLLFVSPRFLFPMDQGGKIRTGNILRGMKGGGFEITLASPAPADTDRFASDIAAACDHFIPWTQPSRSRLERMSLLASALPVAVASDRSHAGRTAIAYALGKNPNVFVVDFPHAAVLIPNPIPSASVIFTHNIEAEIFERNAVRANGIWRMIWSNQSRKMARFEREALRGFDTVVAVSRRDAEGLAKRYGLSQVESIDTGVDLGFFSAVPANAAVEPGPDGGTLVFTATMGWAANVEGIHFLLDEVWPSLVAARPRIKAIIIGRDPPRSLANKIRERRLNVELTGFVDDIRPYVARSHIYVIPLWAGSGTRIKVFEAMAMGRPVISTALGVEGLDVTDGDHFIRADSAEAFVSGILRLLDDAAFRERIARTARSLMEERFSWKEAAAQFEAICRRTMERMVIPATEKRAALS